jgi:hypothetical protein
VFDESQEVINNSRSSDQTFVIAIVVDKAVEENMFERFSFDALVFSQGKDFG